MDRNHPIMIAHDINKMYCGLMPTDIDDIGDRLHELSLSMQWRHIDIAPTDGTVILLGWINGDRLWRAVAARWYGKLGWYTPDGEAVNNPEIWMEIPKPPNAWAERHCRTRGERR